MHGQQQRWREQAQRAQQFFFCCFSSSAATGYHVCGGAALA